MSDKNVIGVESSFLIDIERGNKQALEILNRFKESNFRTVDPCAFELLCCSSDIQRTLDLFNTLNPYHSNLESMFLAAQIHKLLQTQGEQIGVTDCLIAGIFLANNVSKVITKDKHFSKIPGLSIISY